MRLSSLSVLFSFAFTTIPTVRRQSNTADTYLASESPIAKANLLANIGPSGSKSQGAEAGIVIASPSATNPDYLYTWTRDSSLVFQVIIDQYVYCDNYVPTLNACCVLDSHLGSIIPYVPISTILWPPRQYYSRYQILLEM